MSKLEKYFEQFRKGIVGINTEFDTPYGRKKMIYADWIASGRLYAPIEKKISEQIGVMVGNTHSEASETGVTMTKLYHYSHKFLKKHVNASDDDIIITIGSGMTGVANKFQRILGLKVPEQAKKAYKESLSPNDIPVVFITHIEHHSNHTSWLETIADVVVLEPNDDLRTFPLSLKKQLDKYKDRTFKIGSFSAASNVTGIKPCYHELAGLMHEYGGYAFVDFAASAPYIKMDMHPSNRKENEYLDAIFYSPHKALGGPGSTGVLIFNKKLYTNKIPDQPGGGTVAWTNRWNEYAYTKDIEAREDGGTPAFLQTIKAALSMQLKEDMGVDNILAREEELNKIAFAELAKIEKLHILAENHKDRIGAFSFYVEGVHHNLIVKILNDRYGIQVRGGCSCAGTYGHYLLNVTMKESHRITNDIDGGDLTEKPGWVRMSIHPTMRDSELYFISDALSKTISNIKEWKKDYIFDKSVGEFFHKNEKRKSCEEYASWFNL